MTGARIPNWVDGQVGRARPSCRRGRRTGPAGCPGTARRAPHTRSPPTSPDDRRRAGPGRVRPGAAARGRRARGSRPAATTQVRIRRGRRTMPGSTASTYRPTGTARRSVSEWLPTASPKTTVAATSQRSARGSVADHDRPSPRTRSSQPTSSRSRIATSARWRTCGSACVPIDQAIGVRASARPAATPMASERGQRPDQVDRHGGGDAEADRREQVHAERVVAERLEHDRGEPAQQDVGREARRVGGAQDGPDRLELPGVPERDAGQQREAREGERHDADREGRRQVRGARTATLCYAQIHLPRSCRSRSR